MFVDPQHLSRSLERERDGEDEDEALERVSESGGKYSRQTVVNDRREGPRRRG